MNKNLSLAKATFLTVLLLIGVSYTTMATTYTAAISGNWSSSTTWGGTAPGFNISGADNVVVPVGIVVTLDGDLTVNNASAALAVAGTLTGTTTNIDLFSGTLSGSGLVTLHYLTVGAAGAVTSLGTISVNQLSNSQPSLSLAAILNVSNTLVLNGGVLGLTTGGALNLANNVTITMAGGTYNALGGLPTLAGSYNLLYTGAVSTIGTEAALLGLEDVTVNLASTTNQLSLAGNLTVTGALSLQQGVLNLAGNTLTIAGGVNTSANGSIAGSNNSNLVVNGTGSVGTIAFKSTAQTLNNLTLNIISTGSVSLASDLTVKGITTLTAGSLNLNGQTLTVSGTIAAAGLGTITGSSTSGVVVNGAGAVGTLMFSPSGNTLGSLTVNTTGVAGTVLLGSALIVTGALNTGGGTLNLNGQNLTISGSINSSGTGSISSSALSSINFNGAGNAGTLTLTTGLLTQTVNDLTVNIGSTGTVALGSAMTVAGTMTLAQGTINIGKYDLTIPVTGTLTGGSSASYVATSDTGSLIMTIAAVGANAQYKVGTIVNYAPVTVTNNSALAGSFNVTAHQGVFSNGFVGGNMSTTGSVVNTSWDVSSSIVTGANVDLEMFWNTSMQVNGFDNTQAYVAHYTGGAWTTHALAAASAHAGGTFSMTLAGVTSFSPFAVFDRNTTTAITDLAAADMLQVYPNPASDKMMVQTGTVSEKTNIEISDISGQIVGRYILAAGNNSISVADLSAGSYFIKVSNSQVNAVKKFAKI
jgi:hypothetical protein